MSFYSNCFSDDTPDNCEDAKRELAGLKALPGEQKKEESIQKRIKLLKLWIKEICS
jgi:hypothetical protein